MGICRLCSRELVVLVRWAGGGAKTGALFGRLFNKFLTMLYPKKLKLRFFAWFVNLAWLKTRTTKVGPYMILYQWRNGLCSGLEQPLRAPTPKGRLMNL